MEKSDNTDLKWRDYAQLDVEIQSKEDGKVMRYSLFCNQIIKLFYIVLHSNITFAGKFYYLMRGWQYSFMNWR